METQSHPVWMTRVLQAAAVYNILWGLSVIVAPFWLFDLTGMDRPIYPQIWQCVGMIVGVYGIGYWIAARDPFRHWPIVLVGLLGKIFGPIGFLFGLTQDAATIGFGATIVTNDLIWLAPFWLILWEAAKSKQAPAAGTSAEIQPPEIAMERAIAASGVSLLDLSRQKPRLVVFLRHLGCTFCREAMADIHARRDRLEREGVGVVLIHMSPDDEARSHFAKVGLGEVERISDPQATLYRSFGLRRGTPWQLFGPKVFLRGLAASSRGHKVGKLMGDGFQMPGVFLVRDGRIEKAFRHASAGDRPDYNDLATCPLPG